MKFKILQITKSFLSQIDTSSGSTNQPYLSSYSFLYSRWLANQSSTLPSPETAESTLEPSLPSHYRSDGSTPSEGRSIFQGERTEPCYTLPRSRWRPLITAEALAMPIRRRVADDNSPVSGQGAVSGPPARNK
ncbi:hypothetical protein CDAR_581041 [Caerostris darwini]|uniref:Uncharacterized protein n=1 Tax=Caerostris darwini TaxID=1538125 RepID=A0AAV4WSB0_9ARAC|nr:hypothetical protein CDAR_581041 [Caerostris darwini]